MRTRASASTPLVVFPAHTSSQHTPSLETLCVSVCLCLSVCVCLSVCLKHLLPSPFSLSLPMSLPLFRWFLKGVGHDGLNKMLVGFDDKTAYAQCTFAFKPAESVEPILFIGKTDGTVSNCTQAWLVCFACLCGCGFSCLSCLSCLPVRHTETHRLHQTRPLFLHHLLLSLSADCDPTWPRPVWLGPHLPAQGL